ncbi:MAG: FecR domain-containing protein [Muribaculaceae bacterium]|nr:FecR domain-containing protein [Muribaculaceae bacterium]
MNACSRLRYPSNMNAGVERHVQIDGQAFFKVAHNENRPFRVIAGNINIKVLGTEFDVKSYEADEMSSIRVKSGKVNVQIPEASMNLIADQQMLYSHASNDFSRRSGPVDADSWCHGELLFANASIADVARELERTFGCRIKLDPHSVFTNRLTGSHKANDLGAILQSLHYVANVGFRTDRNGDIVLYSM